MYGSKDSLINEYLKLATAVGIGFPYEYSRVKTSREHDSVCGEKTAKSIIGKVDRHVHEGHIDYRVLDIHDLIRATLIVERYDHIPMVMDLFKDTFPDMTGRLVLNQKRGYKGIHIKTTHIDGLGADIHIETPQQAMANTIHHKIYEKIRALPHDSQERARLEHIGKYIYDILWNSTDFLRDDILIRSKFIDYGNVQARNDLSRLAEHMSQELKDMLKIPPYNVIRNKLIVSDVLAEQAECTQQFAAGRQMKLNKLCDGIFSEYVSRKRSGYLRSNMNDRQEYLRELFQLALNDKAEELIIQGAATPQVILESNHGLCIAEIEKTCVRPIVKKKKNWSGHIAPKSLRPKKDYNEFLKSS